MGYVYARLKHDEYMRRRCFGRYYNLMTWFEISSAWGEAKAAYFNLVIKNFDSSYSWWKYRKSKFAEMKARYYMTK